MAPTRVTPGSTRCSVLDGHYATLCPSVTFIYRDRLNPKRFAEALAHVLSDFPAFAGRLRSDRQGYRIDHEPASILFETANTPLTVDDLVELVRGDRAQAHWPKASAPGQIFRGKPLFTARLTTAADGTMIVLHFNHMIGDLTSSFLLMRAIAAAYQGKPHVKPLLILDRDAFLSEHLPDPPGSQPSLRIGRWADLARAVYETLRPKQHYLFEFTREQLEIIQASAGGPKAVSVVDALSAHIYLTVRQLRGPSPARNLCMTVNYRKRAGLPDTMLGNPLALAVQPVKDGDSLAHVAGGMRAKLSGFASEGLSYHATKRLVDANPGWRKRMRIVHAQYELGSGDFLINSWANSGAYDIKFSDQPPALQWSWSESPQYFAGMHDVPERPGALHVGVDLSKSLMTRLKSTEGRGLLYPKEPHAPQPRAPQYAAL